MRVVMIAAIVGFVLGLGWPVGAQVVQRIYGTTSGGAFVEILVDSTGRLVVVGE